MLTMPASANFFARWAHAVRHLQNACDRRCGINEYRYEIRAVWPEGVDEANQVAYMSVVVQGRAVCTSLVILQEANGT